MKLIDELRDGGLRRAWDFWSVRLALLFAALPQVWALMPESQRDAVLDFVGLRGLAAMVTFLFALVAAARVIKQQSLDHPK